jgi:hypothetical protein
VKNGMKHLVRCRCVMPQFKNMTDPPVHQFVVFSQTEDDKVVPKHAQCNNCGIIHRVIDACSSEIIANKEDSPAILTIDEIKAGIPPNLSKVLEINNADLPSWEMASFFYENKMWGNFVVLNYEYESGTKTGKYLQILGENLFKVNSFSRSDVVG